jgi:hypothetical protein
LVTIELGQKSERDVRSTLEREVDADRWTRLDGAIRRAADETGLVDLRLNSAGEGTPETRRFIVGRLQYLERMGLASQPGPAQWIVAPEAERTLRDLGLRGDIIKTLHRAMAGQGIERGGTDYAVHGQQDVPPITGRLIEKGLHDELTGEAYAVIDGVDGRPHYVRFPDINALEHAPPSGGIVEIRRLTDEGGSHPRLVLALRSDLAIDAQVKATGATWLDHQLVVREPVALSNGGFGREVRQALEARVDHLTKDGLAQRCAQRTVFVRDLLDILRQRELASAATRFESGGGSRYRPSAQGQSVAGTYCRRVDLASGRFAMIDDGLGFSLVPWRPALERNFGKHVSGVIAGGSVDWSFGRKRGLSI